MNIIIRQAKPEDADSWTIIMKKTWLETYVNAENNITREDILLKDFNSPEKIQKWRDTFVNPSENRIYLSAVLNNQVVGLLTGLEHDDSNEIGAIYVLPEYHYSGIGSALMKTALAKLNSKKKTKLNVVSYNKKAINFYKKHGFIENGVFEDTHGHLPNGKKLPEIEMIKESHE